jgi:hypothetical protein
MSRPRRLGPTLADLEHHRQCLLRTVALLQPVFEDAQPAVIPIDLPLPLLFGGRENSPINLCLDPA